jgi:hypothetical protein
MGEEYEVSDEAWQTAKDAVVEGVLSGKPSKDYKTAVSRFETGLWERVELDGLYECESCVDQGVWIQNHKVPKGFDLLEHRDDSEINEERLSQLEDGASPTQDEYLTFLRLWLICNSDDPDCDIIPAFGIYLLTHSDGRQCFFLSMNTGYAFTEINEWIEGYFPDVEDAQAYLRENGFIDCDKNDEAAVHQFIKKHLPTSAKLPNITDKEQILLNREKSENPPMGEREMNIRYTFVNRHPKTIRVREQLGIETSEELLNLPITEQLKWLEDYRRLYQEDESLEDDSVIESNE